METEERGDVRSGMRSLSSGLACGAHLGAGERKREERERERETEELWPEPGSIEDGNVKEETGERKR